MARIIVTDASVLIAYLDHTDTHHTKSIELFTGLQTFIVHPLTLAEVLVHPIRTGIADDVLARLSAIGMTISPIPIDPVELARIRVRTGLKMPDCIVIACADKHNCEIATYDAQLQANT